MRRASATTLQDVAREAGVTAMTVSVVLNGSRSATRVSDATRVRVQEAATRLRYRPNGVARGLSRRRMDTIGVVAVIDGHELNLYFLELLNGILEEAARLGQNTTVFSITDWQQDEKRILHLCDGRVDGILLIAPSQTQPAFIDALHHHAPFVMVHGNNGQSHSDDLDADNEGGSYAAVQYLIALGHRRIAHLAGSQTLLGARQRQSGYCCALNDAGIACDDSLIIPSGFSVHAGRESMTRLLTEGRIDPLPTAIFCASDAIASGCLEVMTDHGLHAPDDISVVGFDDMLLARMTRPPLTTVRQPLREMGQYAVKRLLTRINEELEAQSPRREDGLPAPMIAPPHTEIFPVELILRESVGPPTAYPITVQQLGVKR